ESRPAAKRHTQVLRMLSEAAIEPANLRKSGRLVVQAGVIPAARVAAAEQQFQTLPHLLQLLGETEDGVAVLVAYLNADREKARTILQGVRFEEESIGDGAVATALEAASNEQQELDAQLNAARETLNRSAEQARSALSLIRRKAEIALGLALARRHFGRVGHMIVISGWVPKTSIGTLREEVARATEGAAHVEIIDPDQLREVAAATLRIPVLFSNPLFLKPFERLTAAYSVPSYGEVEPTPFLAVSFLIMFGVMFGDAGQGLVLAAAGYAIFRTSYRYADLGILLIECGIASIIFGCLYGSVFGLDNVIPTLWFNPMRSVTQAITISIVFGAILISIAIILNVINSMRARETGAAIFGERGLLGAFMYWVCLAIGSRFMMTGETGVEGWVLALLIGLPALTIVFRRPVEEIFRRSRGEAVPWGRMPGLLVESLVGLGDAFLSYLANTVSFIRIAAFALAHVGLFVAVFALADSLSRLAGGGVWYWFTLVVGNIFIIVLEGLMASIQAIRLEYYELFGKFFKGGGEEFRPLRV
ncbi:MAG TPA: V-type ATPase 116kDa subunit family protein, partial [Candidatus Binataceae bacterium]|nr:V-type ATPase 116kDa subunit family protein [Candidatus Binataceae bacterium]